jgi:hypothetical protein
MRLRLLFAVLGAFAAAGPVAAQAVSGGGQTTTVYPTLGSTAAAAANTALIQGALNGAGTVSVSCPMPGAFYVNAPLIAPSNSELILSRGCVATEATGQNTNLLVNYAYTQPWTTLQINSGSITTGPQAILWTGSAPPWTVSTAFMKGNYAVANGNVYWENAASCTSASSGLGPSGSGGTSSGPTGTTGSAVNDGSCSWYYVTSWQTANLATSEALVYLPSHGLTAGNSITLTPTPDNAGSSPQWTGMQTLPAAGGYIDTAFFGTLTVVAVNDSNWFTVALERRPGITGAIKVWTVSSTVSGVPWPRVCSDLRLGCALLSRSLCGAAPGGDAANGVP